MLFITLVTSRGTMQLAMDITPAVVEYYNKSKSYPRERVLGTLLHLVRDQNSNVDDVMAMLKMLMVQHLNIISGHFSLTFDDSDVATIASCKG